jgi:outer membrane protein
VQVLLQHLDHAVVLDWLSSGGIMRVRFSVCDSAAAAAAVLATFIGASSLSAQATPAAAPAPAEKAPASPAAAPATDAPAAPPANPIGPPTPLPDPYQFNFADALTGTGAPLTADIVAKRAVETAPIVTRTMAVGRRAEAAAEQMFTNVYPRLELEGRYTRLSEIDIAPALEDLVRPVYDNFLLQARLAYPVSALFFSILPRYEAAKDSAEAQALQVRVEEQNVAAQARIAFYNYARARAELLVVRAALSTADAHRRDVDALVKAGTLARVELMRADAEMAEAKVNVTRFEGFVAVTRSELYTLMHVKGTEDAPIAEDFEVPLPPLADTQDALLAKAIERRSELKALRILVRGHEHNIEALNGDRLPVLSVGASAEYSSPNQRYFGEGDNWNPSWAAYAAVTWSPNDWAYSSKGADQARADLAQTRADMDMLEDTLRTEVSSAYDVYSTALAALESTRAGIAAAEESYRVRREQFRAGAAVATDVVDAETELRDARLRVVTAIVEMRIAKARLDRAIEAE